MPLSLSRSRFGQFAFQAMKSQTAIYSRNVLLTGSAVHQCKESYQPDMAAENIYGFSAEDIDGNTVSMEKYRGKVMLIVNVATKWTLTSSNYAQLQVLHEKYSPNLAVLAFPANLHIFNQEGGSNEAIKKFAREDKGAGFDLFAKADINGEKTIPIYKYLKCALKGWMTDGIKTNFTKFLIDKEGVPFKRYAPTVSPMKMEPDVKELLAR